MNFILFDDFSWQNLLPLTFTRPVSSLRIGILTIKEKWEKYLLSTVSYLTQLYLSEKFQVNIQANNILINSSVLPNWSLVEEILKLKPKEGLIKDNFLVAVNLNDTDVPSFHPDINNLYSLKSIVSEFIKIDYPWDTFKNNGIEIKNDFKLITKGRKSSKLNKTNNLIGKELIFIEEGVTANYITLNATNGPIYLGKNCEIMEGSVIRGPFALNDYACVKLATKIYGPTTIGPHSKVGGEINNVIIQGYSNKAHDGFLGNSIIGEWCNIGADTNNSNLKNTYSEVRMWNYLQDKFIKTGLQFCGLVMGDHSKCGINTMFNTGTVVGVSTNIYGTGFPRNFIPSFSWGGPQGFTEFELNKALEIAKEVMHRKNINFKESDIKILTNVFELTKKYRNY